ncbi:MAG: hypothetical protein IKC81_03130, partial [Paludibacteraceae bacterium]|nr:hypothetical protein [Paludibacteraceae bacterium]
NTQSANDSGSESIRRKSWKSKSPKDKIDACVNATVEAAKANGYEVIIIADHGNADNAVNGDGTPNTAHSLNPVPCVYVTENKEATIADGILADVAPTILHIMDLEQPVEMTGSNLIR